MDIQLEKIELIKRLADVDSEVVIRRIKSILMPEEKADETKLLTDNQELAKKVREGRKDIAAGKGIKMDVKDLWK